MATSSDFQIDRRVAIALDALSASQRAALESVLVNKERFMAHATGTGRGKRLWDGKPVYQMRAGQGFRVFYSIVHDNVVVLDVMRKATLDCFKAKRKREANGSSAPGAVTVTCDAASMARKE